MEYPNAYYVEHVSMESDTLERIELFGPYRYLTYAEEKKRLCESIEDTVSTKVVKFDLVKEESEYKFEDAGKELRYN
tara:strand:- start:204 stop:434 length:231 start_codon:yes stop_codon:yes gene_type:complete